LDFLFTYIYSEYFWVLANPKSHILTLKFESTRILDGLISLCITFDAWMKFKAQSILYNILIREFSENAKLDDELNNLFRSV
jgi:hypothetical protein